MLARRDLPAIALRVGLAAALAVDAYVHADLAPLYGGVHAAISEATMFRLEAGVASAAALLVIATGRRAAYLLALGIAASALAAVLLYRYVDIGVLGPIPNMYEPTWFTEKVLTAVAEAGATLLAIAGAATARRHSAERRRTPRSTTVVAAGLAVATGLAVFAFAGPGRPANAAVAGPAAASGGQQVTITGNNMLRFSPATLHVHTGKVRITLVDSGAYPHNIVIPALHFTSASVTGDLGGTRVVFTVTFAHPGRYRFFCSYHVSAGMIGTFIVTG
jgi:plastocyanin